MTEVKKKIKKTFKYLIMDKFKNKCKIFLMKIKMTKKYPKKKKVIQHNLIFNKINNVKFNLKNSLFLLNNIK